MVNLERCAAGLRTTFVFRNQVCSKLTLMQKGVILEDDVHVASFHILPILRFVMEQKVAYSQNKGQLSQAIA